MSYFRVFSTPILQTLPVCPHLCIAETHKSYIYRFTSNQELYVLPIDFLILRNLVGLTKVVCPPKKSNSTACGS